MSPTRVSKSFTVYRPRESAYNHFTLIHSPGGEKLFEVAIACDKSYDVQAESILTNSSSSSTVTRFGRRLLSVLAKALNDLELNSPHSSVCSCRQKAASSWLCFCWPKVLPWSRQSIKKKRNHSALTIYLPTPALGFHFLFYLFFLCCQTLHRKKKNGPTVELSVDIFLPFYSFKCIIALAESAQWDNYWL